MKKKFVINHDRIFSTAILLFSIFMAIQTSKITPLFGNVGGSDPGSKFFPYILCVILAVSSIGKFVRSNQPDTKPFFGGKIMWPRILCILAVIGVYAIAFQWLGFLISTFFMLMALVYLMRRNNRLRLYRVVLFSAAVTASIYGIFHLIMKIYLPGGELWRTIL